MAIGYDEFFTVPHIKLYEMQQVSPVKTPGDIYFFMVVLLKWAHIQTSVPGNYLPLDSS